MSQRQEQLKARMWEEKHKPIHEKVIAELQNIEIELGAMNPDSEEYKNKNEEYKSKRIDAEEFFIKHYES